MVDATSATFSTDDPENARVMTMSAAVRSGSAALDLYAALCKDAVAAPPQSAAWVRSWTANAGVDPLMVFLERSGHAVMALALEVVGSGPFRLARFVGGSHANGNFPAAVPEILAAPSPDHLLAIAAAIRQTRPDIDLIALERQAAHLAGFSNPMLTLPHRRSTDVALAVDLRGGFDALLERASGKRKLKKHRSQIRKFEAAGGYRRLQASTPAETDRLLGAFFDMKRRRLQKMGIADVFAEPGVQQSLRRLYAMALAEPHPPFLLHGLEVGGKLRAVTGSSRCADRIVCDFAAISDDELTQASPGDFLFFENIREACEYGMAIYDFSVGDETYKRYWCDIETVQFDTNLPLTAKGQLLAAARNASSTAKRFVKNSPPLWALAKRLRKQALSASVDEDA